VSKVDLMMLPEDMARHPMSKENCKKKKKKKKMIQMCFFYYSNMNGMKNVNELDKIVLD
jgi:hypothetical protein